MWKRSWFRWTVRCVALLLLIILSITFYYRWRGTKELEEARKEFTEKVGPLDPKAYEPKPVTEEDNGWTWLKAGAGAVVIFPDERPPLLALAGTPSSQWTKEQLELATRLLDRNIPALTLLHRSIGMKACSPDAALSKGENILPFVFAARLLAVDSRDALRQGDTERFFRSAEALRILTSTMESATSYISLLIGASSERLLLPVIWEAASIHSADAGFLRRANALLPDVDLITVWRGCIGHQTAEIVDQMSGSQEEDGTGTRKELPYRANRWIVGDIDLAYMLRLSIRDLEWSIQPYALRGVLPLAPRRPILLPFSGLWSAVLDWRFDSRGGSIGRLQAALALREMTRLGLEIRKDGLEKGAYPSGLSALPGANTPDPFTGKPVVYLLHPDGSATLTVPDAEALYKKVTQGKGAIAKFTWTLPPLSPVLPSPGRARTRPG